MKAILKHTDAMTFETTVRQHQFTLDSANLGGKDLGPSPKEVLLASIAGCSGMDVVALLKKYKISYDSFEITADANQTETQPKIFSQVDLTYSLKGNDIDAAKANEAITLSLTRFCGVSAMVFKVVPIHYTLQINGEVVGKGQSQFSI